MRFNNTFTLRQARTLGLFALVAALVPINSFAEPAEAESWNAKFQSTYVWQGKRPFEAAYSGANSLTADAESSYSFTATATAARAFVRQTWDMGGEQDVVESGMNQLAEKVDKRRWVLTAGNLSVMDIFDTNAYSHDPRTQFLNWSLMTHGAYDFAADARGYSWGTALEWYSDEWVVRAHAIGERPGKLRLLAFRNLTRMSRFQDATNAAAQTGGTPDINTVRTGDQVKFGFGLNLEQAVSADVGVFARASWADGSTETYAFTEIDRSVSGGVLVKGAGWGRGQDTFGFAIARNGLSSAHQDYLSAGGLGFFVGDGRLNYQPELIVETFYNVSLAKVAWISIDWQYIQNPAYNADRGPVNIGAVRLHTEF